MTVRIGDVEAFAIARPGKECALKPLEEAAEVFGAWQELSRYLDSFTDVDERTASHACELQEALLDECADTIQAVCNLAADMGVIDLSPYMQRCELRNRERGRYA